MDGRIRIILQGQLGEELPVQRSQLVRIFTSSTFTDTSVERNALMREVYPRLKDYCKSRHGLEFQVIDMRWGVRDEATDDHMTSELCMKEIAACQRLSVGPNFVTFLCQKYGYRPFPPKIIASEFEVLRETLVSNSKSVDLLDEWFLRDENCLPPVYILQPISSKLPNFNRQDEPEKMKADQGQWWTAFETIQSQLKFAAKTCNAEGKLTDEQARKFIISVTQDEVTHGILEAPGNKEEHCVCFVRKFGNLKSHCAERPARNFIDVQDGEIDAEAQELLDNLRDNQVMKALPQNSIFVTDLAEWTEKGVDIELSDHQKYLTGFLDTFYKKMVSMIDDAVAKEKRESISNSLCDDILQHLSFCKTKCAGFQGREDILQQVEEYVVAQARGGTRGSPLVLYGESGSGKTSVLAKCGSLVSSNWLSKTNAPTVIRFLGTSPTSSSIRRVLRSLCQQIQQIYNEGKQSDIPEDYLKLVTAFAKNLRLATAQKPLVIFLDSLDQLSSENGAHRMAWIPKVLPEHVALIVSTLPREHDILDALKSLLPETTTFVQVAPFSPEKSVEVLDSWLASTNKAVNTKQRELVEQVVKKCSLPLFLKLAFDEICRWHSYRSIPDCILHPSVTDMISLIFDRLEDYHGKMLASRALAYITLSPNGLAESELEDLLSLDDDVLNDVYQFWLPPVRRIPPSLWTRARSDISSYLAEREADGANVIYWYHRQFIETARKRYLDDDIFRKALHVKCAEYFQGIWSGGQQKPCKYSDRQIKMFSVPAEAKEDRMVAAQPLIFEDRECAEEEQVRYNLRKLTQLPFHLTEAEDFETLKSEVLCNYDFISSKLKALSIQEVMRDFERAEDKHFDDETDLIGDSLRLSASVIAKDPDQLAPELIGRLVDAADRYPNIKAFVDRAKEVCAKKYPLMPLNTCLQPPGGMLLTSLEGHADAVVAVQVSSDSRLVVTGSKDNTARVWTLDNGTLLHTLEGHREAVYGIEITPDDQQVLTYSNNGEYMKSGKICVWNLETGDQIHRLKGHTGKDRCNVALSCDGLYAISGFETGYDSESNDTDCEDDIKEIRKKGMKNKRRKLKCAKFSDDEDSEDEEEDRDPDEDQSDEVEEEEDDDDTQCVVGVWSIETGNLLHWLPGHEDEIKGVLPLEENGQQIAVSYSRDYTMIFWDLEKGEVIRRVKPMDISIEVKQISHDKRHLAVDGYDLSIHRPDGKHLYDLKDPESGSTIESVQFTRDNTRVIAAHCSGEIKVYGMGVGGFEKTMIQKVECGEDTKSVIDMVVTPDDKLIIAATGKENAFVYSVDTLKLITQLPHITTVDKLAMTIDGSRVLTASGDKNVRVWDITKFGKEDRALKIDKHNDIVNNITLLHKQDQAITTAYDDTEFKVWDLKTGKLLKSPSTPNGKSCHDVAITTDDRRLVGVGGGQWYILKLPEFELLNTFQEQFVVPSHFVITPDNSKLVAGIGQPEFTIRIFDLSSLETVMKIKLRSTGFHMLPSGNFLNQYYSQMYDSSGKTKIVQMINSNSGHVVHEFSHGDKVLDYAISSDHSMMVCGCADKDVDLWDLESLSRIAKLTGHSNRVGCVAFASNNQKVASGADEGDIILWGVESKKALYSLKGHESDISLMTFSSDSKKLFTCAEQDLYVIAWCVETGQRLMTYNTYSTARKICFSTLSNTIVVGLQDGRILILRMSEEFDTNTRKADTNARKADTNARKEPQGGKGQIVPSPKKKGVAASSPKRAARKNKSSLCSLV